MADMTLSETLLNPLSLALLLYVLVLTATNLLAQRLRLRMVDVAEEMLAEPRWNQRQRDEINLLLDSCTSFALGGLLPIGVIKALVRGIQGRLPVRNQWERELLADRRFGEILTYYIVSLLAANPFASLITLPAMLLSAGILAIIRADNKREIVDEPALFVASRMPEMPLAV